MGVKWVVFGGTYGPPSIDKHMLDVGGNGVWIGCLKMKIPGRTTNQRVEIHLHVPNM